MTHIKLTEEPLIVDDAVKSIRDDSAGGICVFVGTVRSRTGDQEVVRLEFEAYTQMATAEMQKIADQAMQMWNVIHLAMHHRIGRLEIGEIPVIIAVSAAHRSAAFEACQYCIDALKTTVPIWKKEIFSDGAHWVSAHP
jgi:molybdopterin synthase catalytic subunit